MSITSADIVFADGTKRVLERLVRLEAGLDSSSTSFADHEAHSSSRG